MKFMGKLAAVAVTTAISGGALVAATGTSATAATTTKSVNYNCDLSQYQAELNGAPTTQQITAAYTVPALPATIVAGSAVPAQPVTAKITVSQVISGLITAVNSGNISGTVAGNAKFGAQDVAASLTIPQQSVDASQQTSTVNATGTLAAFTPSQVGANAVSLPSAVTATLDSVLGPATVQCTAASGSSLVLGSVNVVAPQPKLTVTAKKIKAGHVAKIKVVTTPAQTGKAIAKIGKKKVAKAKLKHGKATLKVKGLKKTTKVKVIVGKLVKTVKVKVKK